MDSKTGTYCVGSTQKPNTIGVIEYEKINSKTQNVVKVREGKCDICGRSKSHFF